MINDYIVDKVNFVAKHDYFAKGVCIFANFLQPVAHVLKTTLICDIIDKNDASGSFVIVMGKWSELDLSCRVPDGHLHVCVLVHDVFLLMINPSRSNQVTLEDAIGVPVQETTLTNTCITQKCDFHLVVILIIYR